MPKHQQTSGHTRGYAGQKAKHSANAATAIGDDDSDTDSEDGSIAGSISGASVASTAASAKAAIKSATSDLQKHDPTATVTIESISEEVSNDNLSQLSKMMGEFMTESRMVNRQTAQNIDVLQRQAIQHQMHQQANSRTGGLGAETGAYVPLNGVQSQQQIELMAEHDRRQASAGAYASEFPNICE